MRKSLNISVVLVVLSVAVGGLMSTTASGQTSLHFVVAGNDDLAVAIVDNNHDGLRLGDRISARAPLMDEAQAEREGTSYMDCVVHRRIVDPDRGLWNCNYVLELADGDIVLQGLDERGPGEYEMAILGGTGAYADASGDATFTDVGSSGEDYTDMVLRLSG
jgi:hypothetical protein